MGSQITGGVGGTGLNANMAASLDDDLEFDNQDYYSLLNVRKEVWFILHLHGGRKVADLFAATSRRIESESPAGGAAASPSIILQLGNSLLIH